MAPKTAVKNVFQLWNRGAGHELLGGQKWAVPKDTFTHYVNKKCGEY